MPLNLSAKEKMKYEVMYPYSCPMSHDPKSAKESNCPKCGKKIKKSKS
jgi:PHP family Zn ribbon phosphoesterase